MEKWRPVKGYEGLYEVSNLGNVRHVSGRPKKASVNENGYYYVSLSNDTNRTKKLRVHRLVAGAFIENPHGYNDVNHKDEDKSNNRADNLEWCTRSYNINYGTRNKRHADKLRKPIVQITDEGERIEWASLSEAERQTGYSKRNISACCHKRFEKAYGSRWEFV